MAIYDQNDAALAKRDATPAPQFGAWEPANINEGMALARELAKSTLVPAALRGKPADLFLVGLAGRDHGLSFTQSMATMHVIEGKAAMASQLIVALCKRSQHCEWFRVVESTKDRAIWETKRAGDPEPTRMSFSSEEAADMRLLDRDNWKKQKATMLMWRAATRLARAVYPDIVLGLYDLDEIEDVRGPVRFSAPTPTLAAADLQDDDMEAIAPKKRGRPRKVVEAEVVEPEPTDEELAAKLAAKRRELDTPPPSKPEPIASVNPFEGEEPEPREMTKEESEKAIYEGLDEADKVVYWLETLDVCQSADAIGAWASKLAIFEPKGTEVRKKLQAPYKEAKARVGMR